MNSNQKQTFERVEDDGYLAIDAADGDELYERYLRMFENKWEGSRRMFFSQIWGFEPESVKAN